MGFTWSRILVIGLLMWILGLTVQIVALARQTDPSVSLSWDTQVSCIIIYPASILVLKSYLLRSGGGRRLVGYVLLFSGVLGIGVLLVFSDSLAALFMPRIAVRGMLLVNSIALVLIGVLFQFHRYFCMSDHRFKDGQGPSAPSCSVVS
ncbi:MAG: hypothetical protein HXY34_08550 [Candidatus Thorarchaeota archaeon]|nr:hypothetical protein [Candidatus Thorarchaeota archaeon]